MFMLLPMPRLLPSLWLLWAAILLLLALFAEVLAALPLPPMLALLLLPLPLLIALEVFLPSALPLFMFVGDLAFAMPRFESLPYARLAEAVPLAVLLAFLRLLALAGPVFAFAFFLGVAFVGGLPLVFFAVPAFSSVFSLALVAFLRDVCVVAVLGAFKAETIIMSALDTAAGTTLGSDRDADSCEGDACTAGRRSSASIARTHRQARPALNQSSIDRALLLPLMFFSLIDSNVLFLVHAFLSTSMFQLFPLQCFTFFQLNHSFLQVCPPSFY